MIQTLVSLLILIWVSQMTEIECNPSEETLRAILVAKLCGRYGQQQYMRSPTLRSIWGILLKMSKYFLLNIQREVLVYLRCFLFLRDYIAKLTNH